MWRLYSFVILLIASSICILPLPSRCNIIRSNKIHFPHKTHMATKSNATKIESSVDRIRELGNVSTSNLTIPARGYICAIYLGAMSLKKANLSLFLLHCSHWLYVHSLSKRINWITESHQCFMNWNASTVTNAENRDPNARSSWPKWKWFFGR